MEKKDQKSKNGKGVQKLNAVIGDKEGINTEVIKSDARTKILVDNLYKAVNDSGDKIEGNFTFYEINDAFLRVTHSYNQRALKSQFDNSKT